jgi:hypothetical protein
MTDAEANSIRNTPHWIDAAISFPSHVPAAGLLKYVLSLGRDISYYVWNSEEINDN